MFAIAGRTSVDFFWIRPKFSTGCRIFANWHKINRCSSWDSCYRMLQFIPPNIATHSTAYSNWYNTTQNSHVLNRPAIMQPISLLPRATTSTPDSTAVMWNQSSDTRMFVHREIPWLDRGSFASVVESAGGHNSTANTSLPVLADIDRLLEDMGRSTSSDHARSIDQDFDTCARVRMRKRIRVSQGNRNGDGTDSQHSTSREDHSSDNFQNSCRNLRTSDWVGVQTARLGGSHKSPRGEACSADGSVSIGRNSAVGGGAGKTVRSSKRTMNPYMLWQRDNRAHIQSAFPDLPNNAVSKELGERWNSLSMAQKVPYMLKAMYISEQAKNSYPDVKIEHRQKRKCDPNCAGNDCCWLKVGAYINTSDIQMLTMMLSVPSWLARNVSNKEFTTRVLTSQTCTQWAMLRRENSLLVVKHHAHTCGTEQLWGALGWEVYCCNRELFHNYFSMLRFNPRYGIHQRK